ncbi:MAG: transposase [Bacteroidota bacterium]
MAKITYSEDFRREAVRLVIEEGHSRKQVARDLGVSLTSLRDWVHRYGPAQPTVSEELPEAEQLRQLRRELDRVRQERDILEKAVGSTHRRWVGFSQMPPRS